MTGGTSPAAHGHGPPRPAGRGALGAGRGQRVFRPRPRPAPGEPGPTRRRGARGSAARIGARLSVLPPPPHRALRPSRRPRPRRSPARPPARAWRRRPRAPEPRGVHGEWGRPGRGRCVGAPGAWVRDTPPLRGPKLAWGRGDAPSSCLPFFVSAIPCDFRARFCFNGYSERS